MGQVASSTLICRRPPELRILICGLDASGKTSVLYKLKTGDLVTTIPTIGFNLETILIEGRAKLTMWDLGGRDRSRALQSYFYQNSHGVLYMIDGTDRERLPDAVDELKRLCSALEVEGLGEIPVALLCNKVDLRPELVAQTSEELRSLGPQLSGSVSHRRACRCFVISAATGEGLPEAIEWLIGQALHELPIDEEEASREQQAAVSKAEDSTYCDWRGKLYTLVKSAMLR